MLRRPPTVNVARPLLLALALLTSLLFRPSDARAQQKLCFSETPNCIEGRFAEYWQQNGGLAVFGLPITPAQEEQIGNGRFLTQWFERNRFELHPENSAPYDVLLGRLGDDRLKQLGRDWFSFAKGQPGGDCDFFDASGHTVCGEFRQYFSSHGLQLDGQRGFSAAESLALFGLPLSEATIETASDGKQYLTQWFERGRMELHPENTPEFRVLLGLLGSEVRGGSGGQTPSTNGCGDVPAPKSASIAPNCGPAGTTFTLSISGFTPNEQVGYWITLPDSSVYGTVQTRNVGPSGGVEGLPLKTDASFPPGLYYFVFEGVSSKHQAIAYFKITGNAPAKPATPGTNGCGDVPAPKSASIAPNCGPAGTTFTLSISGFTPNEQVGYWITLPDSSVYGTVQTRNVGPSGGVEGMQFETSRDFPPGLYYFVFEGVSSKHQAIAYFKITG